MKKMQAAVYKGREDVCLEQIDLPAIGPGEVLVRVSAALTCGTDRKMYLRDHPLFPPPFVFGHEFAGEVVDVGDGVEGFSAGQRVTAANSAPCNRCYWCKIGNHSMCDDIFLRLSGAFAEFVEIPAPIVQQNLLHVPDHVSDKHAALVEPLACVVHGIERTEIHLGDTVAVIGAGPIGLMFVALAALRGARVISVDKQPERLAVAERMGAHELVDVTNVADPVEAVRALTPGGRGVDVAIEAVGLPQTWEQAIAMVRKGGLANLFGGCASGKSISVDTALIHYSEVRIQGVFHHTPQHVRRALDLIAHGAIDADALITHEIPLAEMDRVVEMLVNQEGIKVAVIV